MHLFNPFTIVLLSMLMIANLSEELILGISVLLLLSMLIYLLIDNIYDFSFNERKLALKKACLALQELEASILVYQMHLQEIVLIAQSFQVLAIVSYVIKAQTIQRRLEEFKEVSNYVFDDFVATVLIFDRFQSEAYDHIMHTFWIKLRLSLLT